MDSGKCAVNRCYLCLSFLISDCSIFCTSFRRGSVLLASRSLKISWHSNSCVSSSAAEPAAMPKNWINSPVLFLSHPSAIFDGIDMAALCICEASPYRSVFGNCPVKLYTSLATVNDFCQTTSCL